MVQQSGTRELCQSDEKWVPRDRAVLVQAGSRAEWVLNPGMELVGTRKKQGEC